jgi:hypothetical protein
MDNNLSKEVNIKKRKHFLSNSITQAPEIFS